MNQRKLTPKQQSFVLAYVTEGCAAEAYRQSYRCESMKPKTVKDNASKLLHHTGVAAAIEAERERIRQAHEFGVEQAHQQLYEALAMARRDNDAELVRKVTMDMSKLHGLLVERKRISVDGQIDHVSTMKAVRAHMEGRKRDTLVRAEPAKSLEYREITQ